MSVRLVLLSVFVIAFVGGCGKKVAPTQGAVVPAMTGTVTIEVVNGDETKEFLVNDVADGTSLEDVMRGVKDLPIEMKGSGITAFVQSIDGVATNQTEGWTYRVDGKHASVGIGSLELHPPTTITWRFVSWDDVPVSE